MSRRQAPALLQSLCCPSTWIFRSSTAPALTLVKSDTWRTHK
jgi:hypothetical protein